MMDIKCSIDIDKVIPHNQAFGCVDQLSGGKIIATTIDNGTYLLHIDSTENRFELIDSSSSTNVLEMGQRIVHMVTLQNLPGYVSVHLSGDNESPKNIIRVTDLSDVSSPNMKEFEIPETVHDICPWVNGKDFVCSVKNNSGSCKIQYWTHDGGFKHSLEVPDPKEGYKYEFSKLYPLQYTSPKSYISTVAKIIPNKKEGEDEDPTPFYEVWIWNIIKKRFVKRLKRKGSFRENEITSISSVSIVLERDEEPVREENEEMEEDGEECEDTEEVGEEMEEMIMTGGRDGITFWRDLKVHWMRETSKEVEIEEDENFLILDFMPEGITEVEEEEVLSIKCINYNDEAMLMFVVTQYGLRCYDLGGLELITKFFDDDVTVSGLINFQKLILTEEMEKVEEESCLLFCSFNPIHGAVNIWRFTITL